MDEAGMQHRDEIREGWVRDLENEQARSPEAASKLDHYLALAATTRDHLVKDWIRTEQAIAKSDARVVCYFSAEFLLGRHLENNLLASGLTRDAQGAAQQLGVDFNEILEQEEEPGLGNGGLGRLAACYLDSLSTLGFPAYGFGIRYEFGIFDQEIRDGWQVEISDRWLQWGNPWEVARPQESVVIGFAGHTESHHDEQNRLQVRWIPGYSVKAVPYDTPIPGYRSGVVNTLRLWKAEAVESFNFQAFNRGDYSGAVREKVQSENVSKILYPNDEDIKGKELRLEQQFFFVSASLQHLIRAHLQQGRHIETFNQKWAAQMNDTHPSISVAELMRLMVDEHGVDWDRAWDITVATLGYTNHTLLPEALEKWPVSMFGRLLPRHLEIIYEINRRFLDDVRLHVSSDHDLIRRVSLIDEGGERSVRMAHLATVGSHAVNGVAALHSELLKKDVLRDLYQLFPKRFSNVTNGITPRRWLALANPELAGLITEAIGDQWLKDLNRLSELKPLADDAAFRDKWRRVQLSVKERLVNFIEGKTGVRVQSSSMFDVMVKRIHEYKRQHLAALHILSLYHRLKQNPSQSFRPRTFLFGGKAAPSYGMAKLIIKLINSIAETVGNSSETRDVLRVVFLPDYNVSFGQQVYPAADLSEQISLAGKEASGTGNMKFALNGALTVGTLDGANIKIREAVGAENFFVFGMTTDEVYRRQAEGYRPETYYEASADLRIVIDSLTSGEISNGDRELFRPLADSLKYHDPFMLLADYQSYIECQDHISSVYRDPDVWIRMSIHNTAGMGYFSSDRAIQEYATRIWNVRPLGEVTPQAEVEYSEAAR